MCHDDKEGWGYDPHEQPLLKNADFMFGVLLAIPISLGLWAAIILALALYFKV